MTKLFSILVYGFLMGSTWISAWATLNMDDPTVREATIKTYQIYGNVKNKLQMISCDAFSLSCCPTEVPTFEEISGKPFTAAFASINAMTGSDEDKQRVIQGVQALQVSLEAGIAPFLARWSSSTGLTDEMAAAFGAEIEAFAADRLQTILIPTLQDVRVFFEGPIHGLLDIV